MASEREISLEIIKQVLEDNKFYKDVYESLIERYDCDYRERGFINNLSLGTIERSIELDYIIDLFSSKPSGKLKPYIRNILRQAVYQMRYMDKVPDSAAVNEAVKLTRKKGYAGLSGFVNGVLRNIIRNADNISYPDRETSYEQYLKVKYSMPEWIVKRFLSEESGGIVEAAFDYFTNNKTINIRLANDTIKISDAIPGARPGVIFDDSLKIEKAGRIEELPGYSDGAFAVQDESAMIPAKIIAEYVKKKYGICGQATETQNRERIRILDLCSAPGGKILQLAGMLGDRAEYTACDISESKTRIIYENAGRLKIDNINIAVRDALTHYESDDERYDAVIADLPCSGLGVIAKKPDIKYNTKPEDIEELAKIQRQMLDIASNYVKRGGILVYSTCTLSRAENEENAAYFLDTHKDFQLPDISEYIPETLRKSYNNGFIKIMPGEYESDGFFVAAFIKG